MAEKVTFIETTQDKYDDLAPNAHTFYKCSDTNRCFLGENELTNEEDVEKLMAVISMVEAKADSALESAEAAETELDWQPIEEEGNGDG